MRTGLKRGLVLGMSICMAATSLAGCSKEKKMDTTAAVATLDGASVDAGVMNFMLRYQQAQFESSYGAWLKSYYNDIWSADLSGNGVTYGQTFKNEIMTAMEKMLLAEKHMADYGVEITEEDKAAIAKAAEEFIAANGEDVLEKMSATKENVERVLTLYTIQGKMNEPMSADADTEVTDEEAAQRTVSYVKFTAETEAETEAATEGETTDETEAVTEENAAEAADVETETVSEAAETENETAPAEETSEASVTEAEATKTGSADTEAETATEETTDAAEEAVTEAAEAAAEDGTEAADTTEAADKETEAETETETETETEDPAMTEAKAEAKAQAEAFLEKAKGEEDFAAAATEIADTADSISTSSYTFGDDDTYPDAAIIEATKGLEDGALAEEVVEVGNAYYVLRVDDAFDEDATAEKKKEIVDQRKRDAIDAIYTEWMDAAEFTVDESVYGEMVFDLALAVETEAPAETEAVTEAGTEAATEAVTEAATEKVADAETEAATEAVTEEVADAETEAATEAAETETEAK